MNPLSQHEVAENLAPFRGHVNNLHTSAHKAEPVGVAPPQTPAGNSSGLAAGTRPDLPQGINPQNGGDGDSEEGGSSRAGLCICGSPAVGGRHPDCVAKPTLAADALRSAAVDAIHSYLVLCADYELDAIYAPLNRIVLCMEAHAITLAQRGRAEQEQS